MSDESRIVDVVSPACKKIEPTILDVDEPQNTVTVELACPKCLEADGTLPIEPVFKDRHGVRLIN